MRLSGAGGFVGRSHGSIWHVFHCIAEQRLWVDQRELPVENGPKQGFAVESKQRRERSSILWRNETICICLYQ